jgi:protein involved in polysaccharide export with SLBB domain
MRREVRPMPTPHSDSRRLPPVLPVLAVLLAVVPALWAQEGGVRGGGIAPTVSMDLDTYVLAAGDVVSVQVLLEEDLSRSYKVGPSGTISMLLAGRVRAAGLTTDQLAEEIIVALQRYIRRPVVQVALDAEASARTVSVSGYVEKPGAQSIPFGGTLADAVVAAGITPLSDLTAVRVSRPGEASFTVDLGGLRGSSQLAAVPPARGGDAVYVPKLTSGQYSVYGMVAEPGLKPLDPEEAADMDVLKALSAAGGHTEGANLAGASILHAAGGSEPVNLHAVLFDADMSQNKKLGPGDSLIVPAAEKITVAGEVKEPTSFAATEPTGALECLARAGGLNPEADLKRSSVLRDSGPQTVDLEKLWWQGDMPQNILLQPGESLIVPQRDPQEVLVVGAVEKPGAVEVAPTRDRTVLRYVQAAGPLPQADLRRVSIQREGMQQPIGLDLRAVMEEGRRDYNIDVESGDVIFVPEARQVYAIGAFSNAGAFPYKEKMTLLELVATAGSFREDAMPSRVSIIRRPPGGGQAQVSAVDFRRLQKGLAVADIPLVEGDVIFVPARGNKQSWWDQFRDIFWSVAGFVNIFR